LVGVLDDGRGVRDGHVAPHQKGGGEEGSATYANNGLGYTPEP